MAFDPHTDDLSAVVGVDPGSTGEAIDPEKAAARVGEVLKQLDIPAEFFPGLSLHSDAPCPADGEAIGVIFLKNFPEAMEKLEALRKRTQQGFMPIITAPGTGLPSRGFTVDFGASDLQVIARNWQTEAINLARVYGFHVSGAVFKADGRIYGKAEADVGEIMNLAAWEEAALNLVSKIDPNAEPIFRDVGYYVAQIEGPAVPVEKPEPPELKIVARAYYDPALHKREPSSTYAFGLKQRYTSYTRVVNLLQTGDLSQVEAFEAKHPGAVFKGYLIEDGSLVIHYSARQIFPIPAIGPRIPLEDIQEGPAPRPRRPEGKAPAGKLRIVSSNPDPKPED